MVLMGADIEKRVWKRADSAAESEGETEEAEEKAEELLLLEALVNIEEGEEE